MLGLIAAILGLIAFFSIVYFVIQPWLERCGDRAAEAIDRWLERRKHDRGR